jgi:TPR repeat protein
MTSLASMLGDRGAVDEAARWYQRVANAGSVGDMAKLGELYDFHDRLDGAAYWYSRAAHLNDTTVMARLSEILEQLGRINDRTQRTHLPVICQLNSPEQPVTASKEC